MSVKTDWVTYKRAEVAYHEMIETAEKIEKEYWVISGNNLPDDNAIFAALALKIKALEETLEQFKEREEVKKCTHLKK